MKQDDMLILYKRAIVIYRDSFAHTIDPHSHMQSILVSVNFHIVEAILAKVLS